MILPLRRPRRITVSMFAPATLDLVLGDLPPAAELDQTLLPPTEVQIQDEFANMLSYLSPDITVEEDHSDQLTVTDHPVEKGAGNAFIQDNAYKLPAEVTLTYGWAPGSASGRSETFLNAIYLQLLNIQSSRLLFRVKTTRRTYENMVLQGVTLTTDVYTQNALLVRATCKEIIFATTSTTKALLTPTSQANPPQTLGVLPTGPQQLQPANTLNSKDLMNYLPPFIKSDNLGPLPTPPKRRF